MELISWDLEEKVGDLKIQEGGKEYMIKEVDSLRTVGALITKKAESMSAMKFRMNKADKADKAMWVDMKFYQNRGIAEGKKTQKIRINCAVVHSSLMWKLELEQKDGRCFSRVWK